MRHALRPALSLYAALLAALLSHAPVAAQQSSIPGWLQKHVGLGDGQIAPIVLQRARALHAEKARRGKVKNPCYMAMDATRPSIISGQPARRFYVICEASRTFRAVSSGYGNGRNLPKASFANGRQCAKNFSNAEGSKLSMGGNYLTAETRTSFKGYYRQGGELRPFYRTFLLFDGEGDTKNARERAIGGHQAMFLRWQCRKQMPASPHADKNGDVYVGKLVNYTAGRSNGCTTWSPEASAEIIKLVEGNPTTLYFYPEARDIEAVAQAVKARASLDRNGLYWNAACLKEIGAPRFWHKRQLQPVINAWRASLPKPAPLDLPVCR
jgi:hypothetical protein